MKVRICGVVAVCLVALLAVRSGWAGEQRGTAANVETVRLTSTFLERAEYTASTKSLTIYFDDGSSYRYANVPLEVFAALRTKAAAPDDVFRKSIRTRFPYTKLTRATKRVARSARTRKPKPAKRAPQDVNVECPPLNRMQRQDVVSDAFQSVAYDTKTKCLVVYFQRRGTYAYGNVPEAVYRRLVTRGADPGVYFNRNVRGKYGAKRVSN